MVRLCLRPACKILQNTLFSKRAAFSEYSSSVLGSQCRKCSGMNDGDATNPVSMTYASYKSVHSFSGNPPIVIMHGILGSKMNWKSLAKAINQKSGRTVFTVDARNHGESPHSDVFNYFAMAADLIYFLKEHSISKACLMGHSMGGRAAMIAALHNPDLVEKLFVLDISPCGVSDSASTLPKFVEVMRKVNIPSDLTLPEGRKFVDELLQPLIPELGVRQFILSNLLKSNNVFGWRVNLNAIAMNFDSHISSFPLANSDLSFENTTYFIGGALSDYIRKDDHERILKLFPRATFSYIEGAGHWLHAEKPQEFLELVLPMLK